MEPLRRVRIPRTGSLFYQKVKILFLHQLFSIKILERFSQYHFKQFLLADKRQLLPNLLESNYSHKLP